MPRGRPKIDVPGYVYFLQAETLRLIKIGVTKDPDRRLTSLNTAGPDELTVLGYIPAEKAYGLENELHCQFFEHRARGEWFRPAPEILALIEERAISPAALREQLQIDAWSEMQRGYRLAMKAEREARVAAIQAAKAAA